MQFMSSC